VLILVWIPGTLYLAFRRFAPSRFALPMASAVLLVPGGWEKSYVALLWALLLLMALRFGERATRVRAAALGLLVGAAWGLRIDVAIRGLVLASAIAVLRWRRSAPPGSPDDSVGGDESADRWIPSLLLGGVVGWLPFGVFLWQREALIPYFAQLFGFPVAILRRLLFEERLQPPSPAALVFAADPVLRAWLFYGALAWILLFVIMRVRMRKSAPTPSLWIGLFWVVVQVPQFAIERPGIGHLTEHTAAILLAMLVVIGAPGSRTWTRALRVAAVAYVLMFVIHCIDSGQGGARRFPAREIEWFALSNGRAFPMRPDRSVGALVEAILTSTRPDQRVATWPYAPGLNFLAARRMPGRRVFVTPETTDLALERELIAELASEDVGAVVYLRDSNMHGRDSSLPMHFMPRVDAHLAEHFVVASSYDGIDVLIPKPSMGSFSR
jgi:hypothetical protein